MNKLPQPSKPVPVQVKARILGFDEIADLLELVYLYGALDEPKLSPIQKSYKDTY